MRLITESGARVDRPLSDLDKLIAVARATPYAKMTEVSKLRLSLLLHVEHRERERRRFGVAQTWPSDKKTPDSQ